MSNQSLCKILCLGVVWTGMQMTLVFRCWLVVLWPTVVRIEIMSFNVRFIIEFGTS